MNVPGCNPCPGSLLVTTETVYVPASTPLTGSTLIHLPGSAVFGATDQFSGDPVPPLPITMVWDGGFALLGLNEKLVWPGKLSNNALLEATTASFTGTSMDRPGLANSMMLISPV